MYRAWSLFWFILVRFVSINLHQMMMEQAIVSSNLKDFIAEEFAFD
jgi:hypothetical protein